VLNDTEEYFYIRNAQSDIIGIINSIGKQVVSYTYDTWGKLISITGDKALGEKNPYRYRGYRYDTETGCYYLHSRYYNPEIGSRAGKIINTGYRKVCEVKALGPAFRISVDGESFAKSLGKEALGYVGDIGIGAYSAFDSFSKGQIAGGLIDLGATAVGIGIGVGIGAITGLLNY